MAQERDSNTTLWMNVRALMLKHYGKENLSRLAAECEIGLGTAGRIKEAKTSVGIEVMGKIATRFGLEAWQLLVPDFDPENPPTLQPLNELERKVYRRIVDAARSIASDPEAQALLEGAPQAVRSAASPSAPRAPGARRR